MDRAPLQTIDVHEGLDATLTMLKHKLGDDIKVLREYDRSLPRIVAYPGELNQVWTNLIDNAIDAMGGQGTLTVRADARTVNGSPSRSPTPARASRRRSAAGSSSGSSRPRRSARAPVSVSISPGTSWSGATAARSGSSPNPETPGSSSCCRCARRSRPVSGGRPASKRLADLRQSASKEVSE